jgi:hypothetical protein
MWVVCYSNCTWVWSSTDKFCFCKNNKRTIIIMRTTQSHHAEQCAVVRAITSGLHRAGYPWGCESVVFYHRAINARRPWELNNWIQLSCYKCKKTMRTE